LTPGLAGKSTIVLKVAKQFYEDIDCGTLSNNIESKFGLSQFHDKLLFVAPEIKSDLKIEQARVAEGTYPYCRNSLIRTRTRRRNSNP
jgi:adenylate kinase